MKEYVLTNVRTLCELEEVQAKALDPVCRVRDPHRRRHLGPPGIADTCT